MATVAQAAETAGHALTFAFERKMRGAFDECMQQGIKFIPIVAETLGGWDKVAVEEIKKLATAKPRRGTWVGRRRSRSGGPSPNFLSS